MPAYTTDPRYGAGARAIDQRAQLMRLRLLLALSLLLCAALAQTVHLWVSR